MNRRSFLKKFSALAASGFIIPEAGRAASYQMNIPAPGVRPAAASGSTPAPAPAPAPTPTGPGFMLSPLALDNTQGVSFSPFVGGYSATHTFSVNLGQKPFVGNPGGFSPWDPSFAGQFYGKGIGVADFATAASQGIAYSLPKSSGQWYLEVQMVSGPTHPEIGVTDNPAINSSLIGYGGNNSYMCMWLTGTAYWAAYVNKSFTYKTLDGGSGNTAIAQGDTVGIWVDIDTRQVAIAKVGAVESDFNPAYVTPYP